MMKLTQNTSSIEQYFKYLSDNPKKANKKILAVYSELVKNIHHKKVVEYIDKETGEVERSTFIFDPEKANKIVGYIENVCKHSKGKWAGKPIKLELWQKAFLEAIYGFVNEETGMRKYKKVILYVAKKNGKTTIGAGVGLFGLTSDGEGGAEIYTISTIKEQSKLCWTEAKHMVEKSPNLRKRLRTNIQGIFYDSKDALFVPLASNTNSLDGKNVYYTLADEVWAWTDDNLLSMMEDGMSAREQPLLLEMSTMGNVRGKVFDQEYDYCSKVIKGFLKEEGGIVDETILPIIYELDAPSEYLDEECWEKANPNLGVSKSVQYLRDKVNKAKNDPTTLSNLLCKDFNVRQTNRSSWLSYDELNCELTYTDEEASNCYCIAGVDLSSTTDLSAASLFFVKNGKMYVKQMYWLPEDYLMDRVNVDQIPYDKWKNVGWLRTCEGSRINYSDITSWFVEQVQKYKLRPLWVGYDPWSAQYWVEEMESNGFDMVKVIQGAKTMSPTMKIMRSLLNEKQINYNNNPILKWCLSNMSIKSDENENIRPVKGNPTQRIDGAVSLIDALVVYHEHLNEYTNLVRR